jgi:endonuclease/exonuclease/phosphatase family metal-dependent hydrolase
MARLRLTGMLIALAALGSPVLAFDPHAGDLTPDNPAYVRVLSYNLARLYPGGTAAEVAATERILVAVQPDVIAFQEILPGTTPALKARLDAVLGGNWQVQTGESDGFINSVVASRWNQSLGRTDTIPASEVRGVTLALVDVPPTRSTADLYVGGIHFKCCGGTSEDARRQQAADGVAAWLGDARLPGGQINLPLNTPMLILGDFNFIPSGSAQPRLTLLQGAIQDTATYGTPVKGDWDNTDLTEALPLNPFNLNFLTYSSTSQGSHLDRFYYTDSVARVAQAFILNTATIPTATRTALGVQSGDTATASDHLPVVVDFALGTTPVTEPLYQQVFVTEFMADPTVVSDANGEWWELYNSTDQPVDINGWVIRDAGTNFHVVRRTGGVIIAPRSHLVLGVNGNTATNGSVPVNYVTADFFLGNGADAAEVYRGSIKVDGILYGGGSTGLAPVNLSAGSTPLPGRSRQMLGDYRTGPTGQWGDSDTLYNAADRGTPGQFNFPVSTAARDWNQYGE